MKKDDAQGERGNPKKEDYTAEGKLSPFQNHRGGKEEGKANLLHGKSGKDLGEKTDVWISGESRWSEE